MATTGSDKDIEQLNVAASEAHAHIAKLYSAARNEIYRKNTTETREDTAQERSAPVAAANPAAATESSGAVATAQPPAPDQSKAAQTTEHSGREATGDPLARHRNTVVSEK